MLLREPGCVYEYLGWVGSPAYADPESPAAKDIGEIDWFSHPLMEHEVRKQFADLRALSQAREIESELVRVLCSEGARGIDLFGRKLIHRFDRGPT